MAASRLSDSQKQELVARYRKGETGQALAVAYGCSANTVSRVVRAAVPPEELAAIKRQSRPRGVMASTADAGIVEGTRPELDPDPVVGVGSAEVSAATPPADLLVAAAAEAVPPDTAADDDAAGILAIDDADDFGDDGLDEFADDDGESGESLELFTTAVVAAGHAAAVPLPLTPGALPGSVYLLVDKSVELEPRPLRDFNELGSLPEEEQDRRALMLYANPRQAKRQCGRSQRVIKVPDSGLLERRSSYLVAQGITRLVLEGGSLFAIPGC